MSRFLETMADRSRRRAEEAARRRPLAGLRQSVLDGPRPRSLGGFGKVFDLIAEIKPRSPSEGSFPERVPVTAAIGYQEGGAGMISVLTEPSEFGGSLATLRAVSDVVSVPVLAKDFLIDPYQVYEARAAGGDGVLVIIRILDDDRVRDVLDAVGEAGMFALIEAFDSDDLRRVGAIAPGRDDCLVGVNCRDLESLDVAPDRHGELARLLPAGPVAVAESAMGGPGDVERVASLGYRSALVGSALMRSADSARLVREMVDSGRRSMTVTS
ncbi:MAG: indole-3-glycerol phosphate synthase TrpC [Acidimicrobiia bacterium]